METLANPLAEKLRANNYRIQIYSNQLEHLRLNKKDVAEKVREEMNKRAPGFNEELEATPKVVSKMSFVFYIILFCFLTFLGIVCIDN